MKSPVVKRSIVIAGHKTSVSLEDAFWTGLKEIAIARNTTLSDLVASIDSQRQHGNLSSAIRLFVLDYYQAQIAGRGAGQEAGHEAGHGTGRTGSGTGHGATGNEEAHSPRELMLVPSTAAPALRPE